MKKKRKKVAMTPEQWLKSPVKDGPIIGSKEYRKLLKATRQAGLPIFEEGELMKHDKPFMLDGKPVMVRKFEHGDTVAKTIVINGKPATPEQLARIENAGIRIREMLEKM